VYFIRLKAAHRFCWTPSKDAVRKLMTFSKFMFFESVAILLFQQFDRILVGMLLGPASAGIYSVATSVGLRISMVLGTITEVMIPFASRKSATGRSGEVGFVFRKLSQVTSMMIALGGGMLTLWMREILGLWISPAYAEANSLAFRVIILAYGLLSLSRPAHQTLTGLGKVKFSSLVYLLTSCSVLGAIVLLSEPRGLLGASLANLISISLLSMNVCVYRWMGSRNRFADLVKDLKFGLFIPILAQLVHCFDISTFGKMLISLVLFVFLGWVFCRDKFFRAQLYELSHRYLQRIRLNH
jgi:O-antigen/teichoic acid export membrane protein